MPKYFILLLSIMLFGCAKSPEESATEAIDVALTHLSNGKCQEAIDVLEDQDDQENNPVYLQVLASAHACKAGFNEITFISEDLSKLGTTAAALMRSLSIGTYADESEADSVNYVSFLTGINFLLSPDEGKQPSHLDRVEKFGSRKANDIGTQLIFLSLAQMGKFLNWYGNVSATGVKGGGAEGNGCFINYTHSDATAARAATTCASDSDGHADLSLSSPVIAKRRLCEGLVLFTNILDVLENMTLTGATYSRLITAADVIIKIKEDAITLKPALSVLLNTTSQEECEDLLDTQAELDNMELIYALLYEAGLP